MQIKGFTLTSTFDNNHQLKQTNKQTKHNQLSYKLGTIKLPQQNSWTWDLYSQPADEPKDSFTEWHQHHQIQNHFLYMNKMYIEQENIVITIKN